MTKLSDSEFRLWMSTGPDLDERDRYYDACYDEARIVFEAELCALKKRYPLIRKAVDKDIRQGHINWHNLKDDMIKCHDCSKLLKDVYIYPMGHGSRFRCGACQARWTGRRTRNHIAAL